MSGSRFNLSALAVRERSITLFLIVLVTIAGIYAFLGLAARKIPFTVKQMTVISVWPGATAQEMQDQVAEPLENACRSSNGMTGRKLIPAPAWRLSPYRCKTKRPPQKCKRSSIRRGKSWETNP